MFRKQKYEDRLAAWRNFRNELEVSNDPIQDTIDFFKEAPLTTYQTDPYDPSRWPSPWEMVQENIYCPFVKILGICYTLQLTDCLKHEVFEIHIEHDLEDSATYYLLYVGDRVVGFNQDSHVHRSSLPASIKPQEMHVMQSLQ